MKKSILPLCGGVLLSLFLIPLGHARVASPLPSDAPNATPTAAVVTPQPGQVRLPNAHHHVLAGKGLNRCQRMCLDAVRACRATGLPDCDEVGAMCMLECTGG